MTPEQAWRTYQREIEEHVRSTQYGDPNTDIDNKVPCNSWCQKAVFLKTWELATRYTQVMPDNEPTRLEHDT